ncbi:MAG: WGR domain-containing protein [Pseudomonas helleri]|jgi:ribosomal protein S21|uniref:Uncharacterized protein n=1 Tax=Pseudomonas helleri TaxID=1608996 RepID=A0A6A7Z858_9PSED|nr:MULTISPECIES: hypothetical protein [Pseudomonas]MQT94381.1 hypothetical protein [Pseudomonas helleri]MQU29957.1 hypothetical protein [Pseudomonas helleri]MQU56810.1 hypothetical protein [Pseudomonas helleri]
MEQSDWDALKEQMASPWGFMKLKCDGFEIHLSQQTDSTKKSWSTLVYVDGYLKGAWLACNHRTGEPEHEEARRFYRKVTRALHTKKEIEFYQKVYGKRKAAEAQAVKFITYDWSWKSFNSLKKHLLANNTSITRINEM